MNKKTQYNKQYYQRNKDKLKKDAQEYYHNNKEAVLAYKKVYNEENKEKRRERDKEYYRRKHEVRMCGGARERAKRFGLEFDLVPEDISMPEFCPLLGIELFIADGKKNAKYNSPSLDRIDSSKGYTKDNVWVISHKANTMKSSSTFEEFEFMYTNWKILRDTGILNETVLAEDEEL